MPQSLQCHCVYVTWANGRGGQVIGHKYLAFPLRKWNKGRVLGEPEVNQFFFYGTVTFVCAISTISILVGFVETRHHVSRYICLSLSDNENI